LALLLCVRKSRCSIFRRALPRPLLQCMRQLLFWCRLFFAHVGGRASAHPALVSERGPWIGTAARRSSCVVWKVSQFCICMLYISVFWQGNREVYGVCIWNWPTLRVCVSCMAVTFLPSSLKPQVFAFTQTLYVCLYTFLCACFPCMPVISCPHLSWMGAPLQQGWPES